MFPSIYFITPPLVAVDSRLVTLQGCKFSGNLVSEGNFRKFLLIVNITNNRGTNVYFNETIHAMPMSKINHENNVLVLLLVRRGAVNKNLNYCWETVRRESMPRIAEMDVEMTT